MLGMAYMQCSSNVKGYLSDAPWHTSDNRAATHPRQPQSPSAMRFAPPLLTGCSTSKSWHATAPLQVSST